jgi:hypothetical protein
MASTLNIQAMAALPNVYDCTEQKHFDALQDAVKERIEREVRIKEATLKPRPLTFDISCLQSLLSMNIWGFGGPGAWLQMLLNAGARMICGFAQQEFQKLTAPLAAALRFPGFNLPFVGNVLSAGITFGGGQPGLSWNGVQQFGILMPDTKTVTNNIDGGGGTLVTGGGRPFSFTYTPAEAAAPYLGASTTQSPLQALGTEATRLYNTTIAPQVTAPTSNPNPLGSLLGGNGTASGSP